MVASTNPASRSTRKCLETVGCGMRNRRSSSPTDCWDEARRVKMARRFGSATTSKTEVMRLYTAEGICLSRHVFPRLRRHRPPSLCRLSRRAEAVGEPILVRQDELGLPVVPLDDLRDRVPQLRQPPPRLSDVGGRPIETDTFVVGRPERRARPLVDHEPQGAMPEHAEDEPPVRPHLRFDAETEAVDPQTKCLVQIRAWNDRNAGPEAHRRLPLWRGLGGC